MKCAIHALLWLLLGLLCAHVVNVHAASPIDAAPPELILLDETDFHKSMRDFVRVRVDSELALDVQDVRADPAEFKPVNTRYIDLGLLEGRVWVWASLKSGADRSKRWRLDINRQYYEAIDVYLLREGAPPDLILSQTRETDYHDRPINDRMLGVDLNLESGEAVQILIGYRSDTTTFLPIEIGSVEAVLRRHHRENTINWIINGALLSFVVLALLIMPIIGWRLSLSFAAYMLAGFLYVFHADGYTFSLFWPKQMWLNDPANLSFMSLMAVMALAFSRSLFEFKRFAPIFDRLLIAFITLSAVITLSAPLVHEFDGLMVFAYSVLPFGPVLQLAAGLIALRKGRLGAVPYLVGSLFVAASLFYATLAHIVPGAFNLDATLDFGHVTLIVESLAFAGAIGLRLIGMRTERDRAVQAELSATRERLELEQQLQNANEDYIAARKLSDLRRHQLNSMSHDLGQPLSSLRLAIGRLGGTDEVASEKLYGALDYLEGLARSHIDRDDDGQIAGHSTEETVPLETLFATVQEMFAGEAQEKGLSLRVRPIPVEVHSEPVALMRAIANLVSNSVRHTQKGGVLLAARPRDGGVRIEVHDTGPGMDEATLRRAMQRGQKGETSMGQGLGLAIVQELSDQLGLNLEIYSRPDKGTSCFLWVAQPAA